MLYFFNNKRADARQCTIYRREKGRDATIIFFLLPSLSSESETRARRLRVTMSVARIFLFKCT